MTNETKREDGPLGSKLVNQISSSSGTPGVQQTPGGLSR